MGSGSTNIESGQRLFDDAPLPTFLYDPETLTILAANKAAVMVFGYTQQEFIGLSLLVTVHPEDAAHLKPAIERSQKVGYSSTGKWKNVKKDGSSFYMRVHSNATVYNNKPCRIVVAFDIEDELAAESRKLSEEAVEEKKQEMEGILESISEAFFAADLNWHLTYVNRAAEKMYGIKREEVLSKYVWDLFPKTVSSIFFDGFHRAVKEQVTVTIEGVSPATGRWVMATAYPTKTGIAVYFKDISEQRKLLENLSNNMQNLNALINNTSDLIWSVDKDLRIISANQAFKEAVFKLNKIDIKPRDYALPKELGSEVVKERLEQYNRGLKGETFTVIDKRTIEGELVYRETNFNPIKDDWGSVIGVSCYSRNVTERNHQLMKIREQNEKLKEIAWIQSHKVRGPVATILGLTQIFEYTDPSDPGNQKIIEGIKEEAIKLDEIIKEVVKKTYHMDSTDYQGPGANY